MLVSSIGYLNAVKNAYNDDMVKVQNTKNNPLGEGFGHYNEHTKISNNNSKFFNSITKSFISLFSKEKPDESNKYLSLIA